MEKLLGYNLYFHCNSPPRELLIDDSELNMFCSRAFRIFKFKNAERTEYNKIYTIGEKKKAFLEYNILNPTVIHITVFDEKGVAKAIDFCSIYFYNKIIIFPIHNKKEE